MANKVRASVSFGLPFHHALHCSNQMKNALGAALSASNYDYIWLNKTLHLPLLSSCARLPPIVIDQHAEESTTWANLIKKDPRWYVRAFSRFNRLRVVKYDTKAYRQIAGVICISDADNQITRARFSFVRTLTAQQGVDCEYYKPSEVASTADRKTLLFSGTAATRNLDAMRLFVERIMPIVRESDPEFRLLWIGNVQRSAYSWLQAPWIECTGFVKDTPPYFDKGAIFVSPFRMGEGMKTKLVEAMAMGKVIVTSEVGARGIGCDGLPWISVANGERAFAEAVLRFASDPKLNELGRRARAYAVSALSWEVVLAGLPKFLDDCR